jgi:hypothetical protein
MAVQEDSGNSDAQRAMATEAIAAVSDAAIRRGAEIEHNARKSIRNRILRGFVALSVIGGVIASGAYLWASHQDAKQQLKELNEATKKLDPLPKLADMPVAILVPRTGEGLPASDNAVRQKQGFKQAYEEITDDIYIDFDFGALSLDEEKFSCEEASENECEALKEALKEAR